MIFVPFVPEMRDLFRNHIGDDQTEVSDNSFLSTFIWNELMKFEVAEVHDCLIVRLNVEDKTFYRFPIGKGDKKSAVRVVMSEIGNDVVWTALSDENAVQMQEYFPNSFKFKHIKIFDDYLYNTEDLINLSGKKYHTKKNHLNSFMRNYEYNYEDMTAENAKKVLPYFNAWYGARHIDDKDIYLQCEKNAVDKILADFEAFDSSGGILTVNNEVAAFTISEELVPGTAHIVIEKAAPHINGSYAAINQMHLANRWDKTQFVNREDDFGLESLRRAKESYRPYRKIAKYTATLRGEILE